LSGDVVRRACEVVTRDGATVRCLDESPPLRPAVDGVALLNQILELGLRGPGVILLIALGWRRFGEVVVRAVELEVEPAVVADTAFVPGGSIVPARVLDAVEQGSVLEDERPRHLGTERRRREPLEIADDAGGGVGQRVFRVRFSAVPVFLCGCEASRPGADCGGDGCFHQGTP